MAACNRGIQRKVKLQWNGRTKVESRPVKCSVAGVWSPSHGHQPDATQLLSRRNQGYCDVTGPARAILGVAPAFSVMQLSRLPPLPCSPPLLPARKSRRAHANARPGALCWQYTARDSSTRKRRSRKYILQRSFIKEIAFNESRSKYNMQYTIHAIYNEMSQRCKNNVHSNSKAT